MPGIVGIISEKPADECQRLVGSMMRSMEHESFYTSGTYYVPEMGIYGGWVAHEGSFAAGQVFLNERKDVAIIFSGECFADSEIRKQLREEGHELGVGSANWLVHLYEEKGEEFFEALNGIFSGLVIDKRRRRAFLFNDRYGLERIYWSETKDAFYFASEAKALLRVLPELRAFDDRGVAQFLTFGCTLEWQTLFRGVGLLPGGSLWSFENGDCSKKRYFNSANWESQTPLSVEGFETTFDQTFKRILPRYLETDSGIGISLTGGLDTRMIMACVPKSDKRALCNTFAGVTGETLDVHLARRVATACGLDHQLLRIGQDFFSNFRSHADRTVYLTDGNFGVLGSHEIYLNCQARQGASTRLTGNFGSEVLRSMSTFKPVGLFPELFDPEFSRSLNIAAQGLSSCKEHPVAFAAFKEIPWNLFGSLAAGRSQVTFRTPYLDNEIVALAFRAPQSARTSTDSAVRFVKSTDPVLGNIPTDRGHGGAHSRLSGGLRRFHCAVTFKLDYFYNEGLPHWLSPLDGLFGRLGSGVGVLGLHKYLHYRSWLRRELAVYARELVTDMQTRRMPYWNSEFLEAMVKDHIGGRKNYVREINAVLTLEATERLVLRGSSENRVPSAEFLCVAQT